MMHRRQPNSHGCFICGLANPVGLRLVFHEDPKQDTDSPRCVRTELTIPEQYRSYPGVVHGGIVATILDETSGRALVVETGDDNSFFATAKMQVKYRRPTPTETPLVAVGWVERFSEGRAQVRGELRLRDGTVLAECTSLIVKPPDEFMNGWGDESPYWRVYEDQELAQAEAMIQAKLT